MLSGRVHIRCMCCLNVIKRAKVNNLASNLDYSLPRLAVLWSATTADAAGKAAIKSTSIGRAICLVLGAGCISQIRESIVGAVAVNVVNLAGRPRAGLVEDR